ncbi:MAG: NrdH-redoxin, partial [Clostridia bacterium]|nr:NrdH-redoxin [Clostridia bacterium]
EREVVVFTSEGCGPCHAVVRFLRDRGVAFVEKPVADPSNLRELLALTGGVTGTPVVVVDGQVVRGFDRGRLTRLLAGG